jgi:type VI secretion system protein ImpH
VRDKPLNQQFFDEPERFEFFQAVRLLERMFPERAAVGRDNLPSKEVVRFRSRPTIEFPASEVHEIREVQEEFSDEQKLEMFINFMGMVGAIGALPTHYTELVIERARYRDRALWEFIDIFTHRSVSLFFRAWEKYRFPVSYERGEDDFTEYLFDILGLGTRGLRGRLSVPDESLIPYAGLISNKPQSVASIEQTLSDYFGVPVKVEQFFGQWLALDKESITQLGKENSRLGVSTVVGTRVFDNQSKIRLRIGAVGYEKFKGFLPNGSAYPALCSMVRFLVGQEFDFDLQLVLKAREVPSCILTTRAKRRPQLGWTSYLKTKPFKRNDEQLTLEAEKQYHDPTIRKERVITRFTVRI